MESPSEGTTPPHEFHVNTKGFCFLCLQRSHGPLEEPQKLEKYSYRALSRFLCLDYEKIYSFNVTGGGATSTSGLGEILKKTEFSVSLCSECHATATSFTKQYMELEVIKMRLRQSLNKIMEVMKLANEDEKRMEKCRRRMVTPNPVDILNIGILENLRSQTINQSKSKLDRDPKIILNRKEVKKASCSSKPEPRQKRKQRTRWISSDSESDSSNKSISSTSSSSSSDSSDPETDNDNDKDSDFKISSSSSSEEEREPEEKKVEDDEHEVAVPVTRKRLPEKGAEEKLSALMKQNANARWAKHRLQRHEERAPSTATEAVIDLDSTSSSSSSSPSPSPLKKTKRSRSRSPSPLPDCDENVKASPPPTPTPTPPVPILDKPKASMSKSTPKTPSAQYHCHECPFQSLNKVKYMNHRAGEHFDSDYYAYRKSHVPPHAFRIVVQRVLQDISQFDDQINCVNGRKKLSLYWHCPICKYKLKKSPPASATSRVFRHVIANHSDQIRYHISKVQEDREFLQKLGIRKDVGSVFTCETCGHCFSLKYHLRKHLLKNECDSKSKRTSSSDSDDSSDSDVDLNPPLAESRTAGSSTITELTESSVVEANPEPEPETKSKFTPSRPVRSPEKKGKKKKHLKQIPCPDCGLMFTLKASVERHKKLYCKKRTEPAPESEGARALNDQIQIELERQPPSLSPSSFPFDSMFPEDAETVEVECKPSVVDIFRNENDDLDSQSQVGEATTPVDVANEPHVKIEEPEPESDLTLSQPYSILPEPLLNDAVITADFIIEKAEEEEAQAQPYEHHQRIDGSPTVTSTSQEVDHMKCIVSDSEPTSEVNGFNNESMLPKQIISGPERPMDHEDLNQNQELLKTSLREGQVQGHEP